MRKEREEGSENVRVNFVKVLSFLSGIPNAVSNLESLQRIDFSKN